MPDESLLKMHFRADPALLKGVREQVCETLEGIACDRQMSADIVLAISEACMNIIQHAYQGDTSGEIILEILDNERQLVVELHDHGCQADPACMQPRDLDDIRPGGLGTHFMRSLMDQCDYARDGQHGNRLRMTRNLGEKGKL